MVFRCFWNHNVTIECDQSDEKRGEANIESINVRKMNWCTTNMILWIQKVVNDLHGQKDDTENSICDIQHQCQFIRIRKNASPHGSPWAVQDQKVGKSASQRYWKVRVCKIYARYMQRIVETWWNAETLFSFMYTSFSFFCWPSTLSYLLYIMEYLIFMFLVMLL